MALAGGADDRRPDGRRLVARPGGPAAPHRARSTGDAADLVIGSRYTAGGGVEDWGIVRRIISRGGSVFARIVLGLRPHDLTGGFKAWRATTLARVPFDGVRAGGYVFQIEMTYRASRLGARVVEVPITFRDRRVGQSKMSRRIVVEALFVVMACAGTSCAAAARCHGRDDRRPAAPAGGRARGRRRRPRRRGRAPGGVRGRARRHRPPAAPGPGAGAR